MSNPFDYFDAIYCINLDERTDRWEHAKREFEKVGILGKVKRFSAIKESDGRLGIIKSNLEIIKIAKEQKLKNVLVFEDDFEFIVDNPGEILNNTITQIGKNEWFLLYLGANTHTKLLKFKPNLILLKNAFAVHSMAYNKNVYDLFITKYGKLEKITSHNDILDVWLASSIQANHVCLMTHPMLTTQMNSYSDIEKKNVDYSFIVDRYNKNIE